MKALDLDFCYHYFLYIFVHIVFLSSLECSSKSLDTNSSTLIKSELQEYKIEDSNGYRTFYAPYEFEQLYKIKTDADINSTVAEKSKEGQANNSDITSAYIVNNITKDPVHSKNGNTPERDNPQLTLETFNAIRNLMETKRIRMKNRRRFNLDIMQITTESMTTEKIIIPRIEEMERIPLSFTDYEQIHTIRDAVPSSDIAEPYLWQPYPNSSRHDLLMKGYEFIPYKPPKPITVRRPKKPIRFTRKPISRTTTAKSTTLKVILIKTPSTEPAKIKVDNETESLKEEMLLMDIELDTKNATQPEEYIDDDLGLPL